MVEVVCSAAIVPVGVLESTKVVEGGDLVEGELWKVEGGYEMEIFARKRQSCPRCSCPSSAADFFLVLSQRLSHV